MARSLGRTVETVRHLERRGDLHPRRVYDPVQRRDVCRFDPAEVARVCARETDRRLGEHVQRIKAAAAAHTRERLIPIFEQHARAPDTLTLDQIASCAETEPAIARAEYATWTKARRATGLSAPPLYSVAELRAARAQAREQARVEEEAEGERTTARARQLIDDAIEE